MILKMKNDPRIDYFEGSVNEYHEIKDDLFPEWIDLAVVPKSFGDDAAERVTKWMKLRNDGVYVYDSKED